MFIGGTSPVLFEPVYRQAGLGYPRGEIDRQEAFSRRPGATPPPATLLATARKGKPGETQGRKATGPRFLRDDTATKDPKTAGLPKPGALLCPRQRSQDKTKITGKEEQMKTISFLVTLITLTAFAGPAMWLGEIR